MTEASTTKLATLTDATPGEANINFRFLY
jgi:hypothetical protein